MRRSGRRPRKSLGQHWLVDRRVLGRIDAAIEFTDEDTVIEVGSGTGLLTELLAKRARRLIGVEIDEDLVEVLRGKFAGQPNVAIVSEDVLTATPEEILEAGGGGVPYVVVGNLPYNVGTAIVGRFLEASPAPRRLVVTLQAEVAESMAGSEGKLSYLGAMTRVLAKPQMLFYVPPRAFRPPPKVRSAVVRLEVRGEPLVPREDVESFRRLLQAGFAAPRKRVRNSLAIGLRTGTAAAEVLLDAAGIDAKKRPAEVGMDEWLSLYRVQSEPAEARDGS